MKSGQKKSTKNSSQELGIKERKIKKSGILICALLIIILGSAIYGNSLNGKFLWDDEVLVRDNLYIRSWSNLPKIFTEDIGAGGRSKFSFFRPLQMLTYMADYSFWGLNERSYHLTNTLLHILVALCIFWLINIIFADWLLGLFTSILFVAHPIHTAAVSYISGRADSLVSVFMLACLILYIKQLHSKSINGYIVVLLTYILAILSRENSLILPVLLLLYHYAFKKKVYLPKFLPVLSIAFIYIFLRLTILRFLLPHTLSSATLFQRIPGFFVAITNYIRLLFLPFNLHMEYGNKLFNFTDPAAILGVVIFLFLLIYAIMKSNSDRLIFFSISWFFITLLPVSNLFPINAYMAEHWLYLPSIGFFLVSAKGLSSLYRTKNFRIPTIVFIIGLLTFYSYLTIRQNNYWKDSIAFYKRTLQYAANNARMYYNLGLAYSNIGKKQEAVSSFKKAIELQPDFADAYSNLGVVYSNFGDREEAIASYQKALQLNPNHIDAYSNLANIYKDIGKIEEAEALYKKAIELAPGQPYPYYNLGSLYKNTGKKEEAIALFKKALKINPYYIDAYNNLGNVYYEIGNREEAVSLYKKAIEIEPTYARAYSNLGVVYNDMGRTKEAITLYEKAIQLDPNYALGYNNLALAYFRNQQYKLAIEYCDKAKEMGFVNPVLLEQLKAYRKEK